jgi:hypothetical protein
MQDSSSSPFNFETGKPIGDTNISQTTIDKDTNS